MRGAPADIGRDRIQIVYVDLAKLSPYARNSRTHSDEQVAQVAASIMEFGFTNPVLVSDSGEIIAGHARVRAATQLGLDAVPCVILAHLTEAQRRAYVIADNKIALNSGWNLAVLAEEMRELEGFDFDLKITGFVDNELMPLLGRIEEVDPGAPTKEPARGSRELNESDFQKFDHKCPKCGFEYDET